MRDPSSPPASRRSCPACGRPADPGNKFCATCGTWIPVLLTCSKCGTQFIHPYEHCNLCGGPLIPQEEPEPGDSAEYADEEITGPVEDQVSGQDGAEIPEPGADEMPVDHDEEIIVPAGHVPHQDNKEIPEPDTDELLEQYGKEYAEDETLESYHTPKPPSPQARTSKKPVMVPSPSLQESPEPVDDALFLSPKGQESSPKHPGKFTWIIAGFILLAGVVAAVYFIGLPMLTAGGGIHITPPTTLPTSSGTITPTPTVTLTPSSNALVPKPTQLIPTGQKFHFLVQKNPVTLKVSVTFLGSADSDGIQSADIKVSHPDGSFATGIIQPLKGVAEVTLTGSNQADRVEILAHMSDGMTYRVYDQLVPVMGS